MSMNIGSMLRALLGDSAPADGRSLELRIGQIVRGVLLEMLENGDALINIGGVPVRAKLEADLQVGKGTLLQVQSASAGGTIVLKPLAEPSATAADESLRSLLKSFGLPEQKWAYELIRGLKRDGYSLGKESAAYFQTAANFRSASADPAGWMAAAGAAFRKGLPATEETIASLKQALSGTPLHEELGGFAAAIREWASSAGAQASGSAVLADRLLALLTEGDKLLAQGAAMLKGPASAESEGASVRQPGDLPKGTPEGGNGSPPASSTGEPDRRSAGAAASDVRGSGEGRAPAFSADTRQVGNPTALSPSETPEAAKPGMPRQPTEASGAEVRPVPNQRPPAAESSSAPSGAQPHASRGEAPWIGRFLQWLGIGHEHGLLKLMAEAGPKPQAQDDGNPAAAKTPVSADNLKSALLALSSHEEAPLPLREAAQSLANHIAGQQLLLSADRQLNQPYSMMTLFVPIRNPDGDTTASIHVQTRRGRKGEWDTGNCRLLFELRMPRLGDTIVDVQVVNRIVSIKVMNEYPRMAELVDLARGELENSLRDVGFQLFSMAALPLPTVPEVAAGEADEPNEAASPFTSVASALAAKPYKGVDFRA